MQISVIMKKLFLFFLLSIIISCFKTDIVQFERNNKLAPRDASGLQYSGLGGGDEKLIICNPATLGRKFCRFLRKYDNTIWTDAGNYYSDFSDIQFLNDIYFISFFKIDKDVSYCKGWRPGENNYDGIKWNIEIKRDEEDIFWFDYDYYGTSNEIEYSILYKYEVIDSLLHFSSSDDQNFIFSPSGKNYSEGFFDTGEIIMLEGCTFSEL